MMNMVLRMLSSDSVRLVKIESKLNTRIRLASRARRPIPEKSTRNIPLMFRWPLVSFSEMNLELNRTTALPKPRSSSTI
ncbi:hypothetical protein D3C80_1994540 [compost metagenome]